MQTLPREVKPYRQTPEWNEQTLPQKLQHAHRTRRGIWGRIRVLEGQVLYRILAPHPEEIELRPGTDGIIEPETLHELKPQGPARFFVEFLK